jgi:hypothetical protein
MVVFLSISLRGYTMKAGLILQRFLRCGVDLENHMVWPGADRLVAVIESAFFHGGRISRDLSRSQSPVHRRDES